LLPGQQAAGECDGRAGDPDAQLVQAGVNGGREDRQRDSGPELEHRADPDGVSVSVEVRLDHESWSNGDGKVPPASALPATRLATNRAANTLAHIGPT